MLASSTFTDQVTPCRRRRDGARYEDQDGSTLLTQLVVFSCGCRLLHREYHDGCVCRTIIRHDGAVLLHELLAGH